jgi:hypothetical protein
MDIDFGSLDWGKMMANTYAMPPKKDPRIQYKEAFRYEEYYPKEFPYADIFKVLRYIPMVYDKNTPLLQVFSDLKKIKVSAAELAGFKKQEDGRFLSNVEEILACKNIDVNRMIIRYALSHKSALYSKFVIYSELHLSEMGKLLSGEKGARVGDFDSLSDKLDSVRQEILSNDNSIKLSEDFMSFYFEDKLYLRPEDIAKKIQQGEQPVRPPQKKKSQKLPAKSSQNTKQKTESV